MRLTACQETYLVCIGELAAFTSAEVCVTDIADCLAVSVPSASAMIPRLQRAGLVRHTPYRGVALTSSGLQRARELQAARDILTHFLRAISVPQEVAAHDADALKHYASRATLHALATVTRILA